MFQGLERIRPSKYALDATNGTELLNAGVHV